VSGRTNTCRAGTGTIQLGRVAQRNGGLERASVIPNLVPQTRTTLFFEPAPYSAISAGTVAGPASGFSSISSISSVAPAISAAAAANT
jgi:hypothetical protein